MKKILLLVLVFIVSSTLILLAGSQFLSTSQKFTIIVLEAIIFQVSLMDKSFLKKERRAELRKVIDDYPM